MSASDFGQGERFLAERLRALAEHLAAAERIVRELTTAMGSGADPPDLPQQATLELAASAAPQEATDQDQADDVSRLTTILARRGLHVERVDGLSDELQGLVKFAERIARQYDVLRPLLDELKRAHGQQRRVQVSLSGYEGGRASMLIQFARDLERAGLISTVHYGRLRRRLYTDAPRHPLAINFFTGQWLELYAYATVRGLLAAVSDAPRVWRNVLARRSNGQQFELDVVALVDQQLLWVEAKTADSVAEFLPRYHELVRILKIPRSHAILLWSGAGQRSQAGSSVGFLSGMTLCSLDDFAAHIAELLP